MDVYHEVLHNLCEAVEGKTSKAINFKDLVKKMGFHGNYPEIFRFLHNEGWIIETPKADFVSITHWGAAEVKKTSSGSSSTSNAEIKKEANRAISAARELTALLENFAGSLDESDLPPVEKKFSELHGIINKIKSF